jgi:hypothetical protein
MRTWPGSAGENSETARLSVLKMRKLMSNRKKGSQQKPHGRCAYVTTAQITALQRLKKSQRARGWRHLSANGKQRVAPLQ